MKESTPDYHKRRGCLRVLSLQLFLFLENDGPREKKKRKKEKERKKMMGFLRL